jgi:hypothetical protein
MNDNSGILPHAPINHLGEEAGRNRFAASDANLARSGVGNEIDLFDTLPQIIEYSSATPEQRFTVQRQLDSLAAAL